MNLIKCQQIVFLIIKKPFLFLLVDKILIIPQLMLQ